jgi:RNA polymerase sigma-70 factor (ECF subfamily)
MEESDHEIRRAVLAGDKDAYGTLVVRYSQTVFRVAFRITGRKLCKKPSSAAIRN